MPLAFRPYVAGDCTHCLALFDSNSPEYFAVRERSDYEEFLRNAPAEYEVCIDGEHLIGAFGLIPKAAGSARLNWILVTPNSHRRGIGSAIMQHLLERARSGGVSVIDIAASHRSAPFFARFGATTIAHDADGWGPGMHRVDMQLRL